MLKEALEGRLLKLRLFKHSRHCYSYDQFYYVFANRPPRLFRPSSYIFLFFFFLRNRGDANQENLWWHAVRKFWIGDLHCIIIFFFQFLMLLFNPHLLRLVATSSTVTGVIPFPSFSSNWYNLNCMQDCWMFWQASLWRHNVWRSQCRCFI